MKKTSLYILLGVLLFACNQESSVYEGMDSFGTNVFMQLHRLGEGERLPESGDYVSVAFVLKYQDSTKTINRGQRNWVFGSATMQQLDSMIYNRVAGDSLSFALPASKLPWNELAPSEAQPADSVVIRLSFKLLAILTEQEAQAEEAFYNEWVRARRKEAQHTLLDHLLQHDISPEDHEFAGVYVVVEEPGKGELIAFGDQVTMNYQARFLNGKIFDDTKAGGVPLVFKCGVQGQVIWGLSLAVRKLSVGSKARVFIPYAFGFGQEGSSTGIVPPFANLVYDLEIIEVERP